MRGYLKEDPDTSSIVLTGDGCTDLNGTDKKNMQTWFNLILRLAGDKDVAETVVMFVFSQYSANDSALNTIERSLVLHHQNAHWSGHHPQCSW